MSLAPGTRLGPYEIVAALGVGGMGEVYRAKDTRLGRDVAVKVLPQHLSSSPEIRARFEREAKTVSSFNHPNICTLFDVGREGDTDYLVLELIDGETLAQRLAKGALPVADVLKLGAQIADALGRAHRAGVMHRDLKPGNVMLTKSGAKLMDFGLARATGLGATSELTSSPTVAGPLTAEGTILGTFQYMAPEQLEGREADARADLWALGCVLYEMATGRRAFEGATQASLIGAIMRDAPRPMAELAPLSPPAFERVVRHCLAKDPDDRIQTAHDLKLQLEGIAEPGSHSSAATVPGAPARAQATGQRERVAWVLLALVAAMAAGLAWKTLRPVPRAADVARIRFTVTAPVHAQLSSLSDDFAMSPDGKALAFVATDESGTGFIWIRELGGLNARRIEGTENTQRPFWSPDGRFLAFFASGKLKKIAISGGSPEVLCDAPDSRGGSWGSKGDIVFAPHAAGGLFRVSSEGGEPVEILRPDTSRKETGLRFPEFLPDGKQFVFVSLPRRQSGFEIHLGSIDSKERIPIMKAGAVPVWAEPGYLVTTRNQRLVAQRFDPASRKLVGEPVELGDAPPVSGSYGVPVASASRNGILAYSATKLSNTQVAWYDRTGKRQSVVQLPPGRWESASIAPDGRRAIVGKISSATEGDWWLVDLNGAIARRLASAIIAYPAAWSPAGDRFAYQMSKTGPEDLFYKSVDGGGAEEPLVANDVLFKNPTQWSPDGKYVSFDQPDPDTGWDVWRVPLAGDRKPEPLVRTAANEHGGWVSPDGRWIAYTSDESGRDELYLQSYPAPGQRQQLTTTGIGTWFGSTTVDWSRDGHELILFDGGVRVMEIELGPAFHAGAPRSLFPAPQGVAGFATTADHQRFLIVEPAADAEPNAIGLDVNWSAAIKP